MNSIRDEGSSKESAPIPIPTSFPLPFPSDSNYTYPSSTLEQLKEKFNKSIIHPALIIPAKCTAQFRNELKELLINRPKTRDVYPLDDSDAIPEVDGKAERKLVLKLLKNIENTNMIDSDIYNNPNILKILKDDDLVQNEHIRKSTHTIVVGYDHLTVEQVLREILPIDRTNTQQVKNNNNDDDERNDTTNDQNSNSLPSSSLPTIKDIPCSFETVGNVAHLNLREEHLPFKFIIGHVIIDKNKSIEIVVNKIGTIQNEFRTFPMEVLAVQKSNTKKRKKGKSNYDDVNPGDLCKSLEVVVKEDGCQFTLDFCKVYWNSRLQFEHKRLVKLIGQSKKQDDTIIIADACAGIGPFAVPLVNRYCNAVVYANDLNPESYKYLKINAKTNRCPETAFRTYNMDARQFLRHLEDKGIEYDHVIMNLPAIAPEFLNVFRGWNGYGEISTTDKRPMIHVHCFGPKDMDSSNKEVIDRCSCALGCALDADKHNISVHIVRDVSPKKNMYCVSFHLPKEVKDVDRVMFDDDEQKEAGNDCSSPAMKKLKK